MAVKGLKIGSYIIEICLLLTVLALMCFLLPGLCLELSASFLLAVW